jgi:hypothetical protein
LHGVAERT